MKKRRQKIKDIERQIRPKTWQVFDILYILCVLLFAGFIGTRITWAISASRMPPKGIQAQEPIITPLGASAGWRIATPASPELKRGEPTPTQKPEATLMDIIAYITEKFEKEDKSVVIEAINCFYSESKLNAKAYNYNRWNNTEDKGIAQINSIHRISDQEAYDYRKNIDKAYEIYKVRGWSAWYGRGCGRLAYQ